MSLFGWLFPKTEPRVEPVGHFNGDGIYEQEIVGESNYQDALERICGGRTYQGVEFQTTASIVPENDNPHDKHAVRIDIMGQTVGYLNRSDAKAYRKNMAERGLPGVVVQCKALIVGGWDRGNGDRGHFGVRLDMAD